MKINHTFGKMKYLCLKCLTLRDTPITTANPCHCSTYKQPHGEKEPKYLPDKDILFFTCPQCRKDIWVDYSTLNEVYRGGFAYRCHSCFKHIKITKIDDTFKIVKLRDVSTRNITICPYCLDIAWVAIFDMDYNKDLYLLTYKCHNCNKTIKLFEESVRHRYVQQYLLWKSAKLDCSNNIAEHKYKDGICTKCGKDGRIL
jgi:hypothetical protein